MKLIIDAGNTCIKFFVFRQSDIIFHWKSTYCNIQVPKFVQQHKIQSGIVCNTSKTDTQEIISLFPDTKFLEFSHNTKTPIQNNYETPQTLGLDRIAAAVAAEKLFPKRNKLVIDFGTAITIDFIDITGIFQGGNISLGINSRFRALHEFTGKLPLVEASDNVSFIGKNTVSAIRNGVIQGISNEINGYLQHFSTLYPDIAIIFTGGDYHFFEKNAKNTIFAQPNLVALGLLIILEHNEK